MADGAGDEEIHAIVGTEPADAIVGRLSELGPAVMCMSSSGRGRVRGALLGSVARSVLGSSSSPAVVGPQADRPEPLSKGDVVACVDGSSDATAVLGEAARWPRELDTDVSIITVAEDAVESHSGDRPNRFGPRDRRQCVDGLADEWRSVAPDTTGVVVYDPVSVASGLRTYLGTLAALMVVATRIRTGFDRLRVGATAAETVAASTAPALVVPVGDE